MWWRVERILTVLERIQLWGTGSPRLAFSNRARCPGTYRTISLALVGVNGGLEAAISP
jgi:hypothetical protein